MKPVMFTAALVALTSPAAAQHAGHGQQNAQQGHGVVDAQQQGHASPPPHSHHQGHGSAPPDAQHQGHDDHSAHVPPAVEEAAGEDHSAHGVAGGEGPGMTHGSGAYGPYPMPREASGTAWQPDSSIHGGVHASAGEWMLMGHLLLNGVYSTQSGPRGDDKAFVSGMAMASARRDFVDGSVLQFRAMLSPEPLMGRRGYPLHLAAGETADGVNVLVDRQHPHDLFMELSASYSIRLGEEASAFAYAGLPGEPAFGPPAFMHRMSIMDSPEAPITHHWLDSTHITFGVVTAGLVVGNFKLEASRFNGREPDEERYDIETGQLDSTAARLSWNPTANLSLQGSWARLIEPEQLEPGENSTRWSASAIYTRRLGARGWWSTTLAWGRRSAEHDQLDAFVLESAAGIGAWTLFGRAERIETNELLRSGDHHGPVFEVGKVSAGLIHDFRLGPNVRLGVGGLYALNFVPDQLEALYDGDPDGAMLFVRLRID